MSHISRSDYEEFHESAESLRARDDGTLYCKLCFLPFTPEGPDAMMQTDEDCHCGDCREAIAKMSEGVLP